MIPTYNRAGWLRESAGSVLAQSFDRLRLVIADDASTDDTAEAVAALGDPRVAYVRSERNLGPVANFQAGAAQLEGEYCVFMNDDDVLAPEHLAETVRVLDENARVGFVHTAFDVVGPSGELVQAGTDWTQDLTADAIETGDEFLARSMQYSCRVCLSTALIRRAAVPGPFFRAEDFPAFDFGLWLRTATAWDVGFLKRPLGACRVHGESLSAAAIGAPAGGGYLHRPDHLVWLRDFKRRFLDEHEHELRDPPALRRDAERALHRDLVGTVRLETLAGSGRRATFRGLGRVARLDRGILLEPAAWRVAATSLLGGRLTDRIRRTAARRARG